MYINNMHIYILGIHLQIYRIHICIMPTNDLQFANGIPILWTMMDVLCAKLNKDSMIID